MVRIFVMVMVKVTGGVRLALGSWSKLGSLVESGLWFLWLGLGLGLELEIELG